MTNPVLTFSLVVVSPIGAGLLALLVASTSAPAQGVERVAKPDAASEKVIIDMPQRRARIYALLTRVLGKAKGEKLRVTQSEVWSVPRSRLGHLVQRLKLLGCKVTRLREDWNHVLKRHKGPMVMSPVQDEMLKIARASPEIVGIGLMKASEAPITEYALTGDADRSSLAGGRPPEDAVSRIVIPINDAQNVTVRRERARTTETGTTWRGAVEETGESALLMWWKDGHLSGVFGYKGRIYTIVNMGAEVHAVVEADPKKMPPDHAPSADAYRAFGDRAPARPKTATKQSADIAPLSDAERLTLEAKKVTIDLIILYTKKAASRYIRDPGDLIALGVEQANETFQNSGVGNVSLRLVHTQMIDYEEEGGEHFDHLYRLVDGVGAFNDVRKLRNEKRADIVGLILEDPSGCGLSTRVGADAEEAYFVVHHSCAAITISIAHEVGHILGARHDRSIDPNNFPFPYGHGYMNGTKWRDIMSYQKGCEGCPRMPFWSNPRIKYQGEPTGTLAEDNARVILEQAERVSKFR
jgi:peptidyl-Asp metalloendopeptidase